MLNVLSIDNQYRKLNVLKNLEDLFVLEKVNSYSEWDYSLPTIISPDTNSTARQHNKFIKSTPQFVKEFNSKYGTYLSEISYDNILIAGGGIGSVLFQTEWNNDLDIFLYGLSITQATDRLKQLMSQIQKSYIKYIDSENAKPDAKAYTPLVINIRNKNCLTMKFSHPVKIEQKVQIIFRIYNSKSEILHGFDLGSCAVGYDGKNVYFTSLGKFSFENLVNIVDTTRRSITYESRLIKYYNRGFSIILPYFDTKELRLSYLKYNVPELVEMPYLVFSYTAVVNNKITLGRFIHWGRKRKNANSVKNDYMEEDIDEYKIFYINVKLLAKEDNGSIYYYDNTLTTNILNQDVFPYISPRRIIDFYDNLGEKICTGSSQINIKSFSSYFSPELLKNIALNIFFDESRPLVEPLIEKQKKRMLKVTKDLNNYDHSVIPWITDNPGKQLTSSFNPIIEKKNKWYGIYYNI